MAKLEPEQQRSQFEWRLWFQWIAATALGWLVGWLILGEVGIGAALGLAQWLILRREVFDVKVGWWILLSAAAWFVGWEIITAGLVVPVGADLITSLVTGAVVGLLLGIGQWLLLRRWVHYASMWIPTNLAAWSVAFTGLVGGMLFAGVVGGAVTGLVLDMLLRYPRLEDSDRGEV